MAFRVFRSENYERKLDKLDKGERDRVLKFEQELKVQPFSGKPLGYKFIREKKLDGKRLISLVYEEHQCVFLVALTNKKAQQQEINFIKTHLDVYKKELDRITDKFKPL
jgi:mRNA-degrading endonuclease RelE of RelBE toxin-antitoxin system